MREVQPPSRYFDWNFQNEDYWKIIDFYSFFSDVKADYALSRYGPAYMGQIPSLALIEEM